MENLKTKHVFWGILFISLGIFILIDKFIPLEFTSAGIWKLWPIVIILWGVSFIINKVVWKTIIIAFTAFFLSFALFASFNNGHVVIGPGCYFSDDNEVSSFEQNTYEVGKDTSIKKVDFNFEAGAGTFVIKDSSSQIFYAKTQGRRNNYSLDAVNDKDLSKIDFSMKEANLKFGKHSHGRNRVEMSFNPSMVYNMQYNFGAAKGDFDLTKYKIENIEINTGAADLKVKLGSLSDSTMLTIDAGAAKIEIYVPEEINCEIESKVSVSSTEYNGFNKIDDDIYRNNGYIGTGKKIILHIDGGVNKVIVNRYKAGTSW